LYVQRTDSNIRYERQSRSAIPHRKFDIFSFLFPAFLLFAHKDNRNVLSRNFHTMRYQAFGCAQPLKISLLGGGRPVQLTAPLVA
jgi:hypothetical protein